jgi:hypothetical protein
MKQIRVTQLESFRRFQVETSENYDTEAQLIESLSGKFEGNDKTNIGSAFHYCIENYNYEITPEPIIKLFGVTLNQNQINQAINHAAKLGTFTPEIRLPKTFKTKYGDLSVTGQTDVLQGLILRDTKVTFKPRTFEYYFNSAQWKIYLSIFGLDKFYYDVFEVQGYDEIMGRDISNCTIKQYEPIECLRYEQMEKDIETLIYNFCEWVEYRCLWHLIPEIK